MYHTLRMTATKIAQRLQLIEPLVYRRRAVLEAFRLQKLPSPDVLPDFNADLPDIAAVPPYTYWGESNLNYALHGWFSVPAEFDQTSEIALYLPLGNAGDFSHPEALAYIDGQPYATIDRHHQEFRLNAAHLDGQMHRLTLHGWTNVQGSQARGGLLLMGECAVVQIDRPTRDFIAAGRTALQAANLLDEAEPAKARLYNALDEACKRLDTREPFGSAFYASVPGTLAALREGIAQAGSPLDIELVAAGHAHIDVAWLWTLGQTRRKAGRTFHTVLRLMEQFPDYHFTQSQPQLYDYVGQDYPDLLESIRQRVAEGRWEPIGGMWIEADCNISGSESLARQFLLGRTYFREQFGAEAESRVLWLPDVFGYAWNLPQLIKLAGMEYFFTIKIGWNQVNKLPYDSFWWQGLDGTKVLTHFSTSPEIAWQGTTSAADLMNSATYNANLSAFTALGSWKKLKHKESQRVLLMSYGYGDGGGGPTREMNENARELANFPALPRVRQGKVIDFFRQLEAESGAKLPTWNSELYLEIHRGTYTTQSRNKRANRKSEFRLHDAEFLASAAALLDATYAYPQQKLRKAWEAVCLNQFHDIIPGSSIGEVYVESQQQYGEIRVWADEVSAAALTSLRDQMGGDVLLVNPTSFQRNDAAFVAIEAPAGQHLLRGDQPVLAQPVESGLLLAAGVLDSYSFTPLTWAQGEAPAPTSSLIARADLLENDFLRVELNAAGDIVRIYDKIAQREALPEGAVANQWQAFEDRPVNWDAWDVDIFYDDKMFLAEPAESIRVVESGPLRATLEIERRILSSRYTQRVSLAHNRRQIDFQTHIDWRERHVFLKAAFPVDVLSPVARFEVQWGHVERPTHRNTSWDWARFETCAQKWVDLSEGAYGAALLNDCKYGHDIHDNVIRISLLRAPTYPDPQADQGEHDFAYSLLLHNGTAGATDAHPVARPAYLLNNPLLAVVGNGTPAAPTAPLLSVDGSAIIETVKRAEDGNGLIVRLYEASRRRGWVTLRTGFPLQAAHITNLLEDALETVAVDDHSVRVYLTPFQIVTLRLIEA